MGVTVPFRPVQCPCLFILAQCSDIYTIPLPCRNLESNKFRIALGWISFITYLHFSMNLKRARQPWVGILALLLTICVTPGFSWVLVRVRQRNRNNGKYTTYVYVCVCVYAYVCICITYIYSLIITYVYK